MEDITGFGPARYFAALAVAAQPAARAEEEEGTSAPAGGVPAGVEECKQGGGDVEMVEDVEISPEKRLVTFVYTSLCLLPGRIKGLTEASKEGIRTLCGNSGAVWDQCIGESFGGWCLVCTVGCTPSPCTTYTHHPLLFVAPGCRRHVH